MQLKGDKKQLKIGRTQLIKIIEFTVKGAKNMNFSDNLKKIRKENNLSQEQLAEMLGVSRQAVSKWESNLAYPEMDKMIQIAKKFNLNIDELINQDVSEVNNNKQVKNNINKYIDDFFGYVTKTIDMFSSMKFMNKVKCVFEQVIIVLVLSIGLVMLGIILGIVYQSIFSFLPEQVYYPVYHFFEGIYIFLCGLIIIILECHIFKVRYLDYYEIVSNKNEEVIEGDTNDKKDNLDKKYLEKNKEKIIIRDPKHTEYKFISGLLKCLLFFIKFLVGCILVGVSFLFMSLVIGVVISFMFIKTGILFWGLIMGFLGGIGITLLILIVLYKFIVNSKINKRNLLLGIIISLVSSALGSGLGLIGITKFDYIDSIKGSDTYEVINEEFQVKDDILFINPYGNINYVVSNNNDIEIMIEKSKTYLVVIDNYWNSNVNYIHIYPDDENIFKNIRKVISDINDLKIVNYGDMIVTIKTSQDNIDILKDNYQKYLNNNYNE